jgi:hypothetical protein
MVAQTRLSCYDIPLTSLGMRWHITFKRLLSLPPRPVFPNRGSEEHR